MNNFIEKVYAQTNSTPDDGFTLDKIIEFGNPFSADLDTALEAVYGVIVFALQIAGTVALAMIFYACILYVLSIGDDAKVETAKKTIYWALIGLAFITFSFFIVGFLAKQLATA